MEYPESFYDIVYRYNNEDENAFIAIPTQRLTLIPKTYEDILKYI